MYAVPFVLGLLQCLTAPTAFESAIRQNDAALVSALIRSGARVNPPSVTEVLTQTFGHRPRTPLEVAILYSDLKTIEVLLEFDADVHRLTSAGQLPMQLAFLRGRHDVGALLRKYEAVPLGSPVPPMLAGFFSFSGQRDPEMEEFCRKRQRASRAARGNLPPW